MKYLYSLLLLLIAFACSSPDPTVRKDKQPYSSANKHRELKKIINRIPAGDESEYGFSNRSEIDSASVGTEFTSMRWNGSGIDTIKDHQFPVTVGDEFRSFVTFSESGDSLVAVDFGATGLAHEVQGVLRKFPQAAFGGIVRVYQINGDFLCLIINNEDFYYPLESVRRQMPRKGIQSMDLMTRELFYIYLKGLK